MDAMKAKKTQDESSKELYTITTKETTLYYTLI